VREKSRPILEAVVALAARFQEAGQLRNDVEPSDMVRAGLALILYPVVDAPVLEALLPEGDAPAGAAARRKRLVTAILLRGLAP
jgi:hypothetical protein